MGQAARVVRANLRKQTNARQTFNAHMTVSLQLLRVSLTVALVFQRRLQVLGRYFSVAAGWLRRTITCSHRLMGNNDLLLTPPAAERPANRRFLLVQHQVHRFFCLLCCIAGRRPFSSRSRSRTRSRTCVWAHLSFPSLITGLFRDPHCFSQASLGGRVVFVASCVLKIVILMDC